MNGEQYTGINMNKGLPLVGINISIAEWTMKHGVPGIHGEDYFWPAPQYKKGYDSPSEFINMGMTTIRLPFLWERIQNTLGGPLNKDENTRLNNTTHYLLDSGAYVILDIHNYARYQKQVIGKQVSNHHFADVWRRLAIQFKDEPKVIFGLMNEPKDMPTEDWLDAANAAISAIRSAGANNLILVPGNAWSGAHSWRQNWYGSPNATIMLKIEDPIGNYAYEVHQYMNKNNSYSEHCMSKTIGSERMQAFTSWLIEHNKRGFLGEFAANDDDICLNALDDHLRHIEQYSDYYLGWTWWAASPVCVEWTKTSDPFCRDKGDLSPQMKVLQTHLNKYKSEISQL